MIKLTEAEHKVKIIPVLMELRKEIVTKFDKFSDEFICHSQVSDYFNFIGMLLAGLISFVTTDPEETKNVLDIMSTGILDTLKKSEE